jgi:outer membrane protein assembly factor BamB
MRSPFVQPCSSEDPSSYGEFRLLGRLGQGGFGTVYLAVGPQKSPDPSPANRAGQFAAVKVVRPPGGADETAFRPRFAKEVAAIDRVGGEFVPGLLDERSGANPPWLATELVAGVSLDKVIGAYGPLPESTVWRLAAGIAEALAEVHGKKLVHRDIKPHNVLITPNQPWIIDFGLAHLTDTRHLSSSQVATATPQYAAPEQITRGLFAAETPADIFALGATLLYAATGHPPRDSESRVSFLTRDKIAGPNLVGLPRGLYGLVENCMLNAPEARPALAEIQAEISRHVHGGHGGFSDSLPRDVHLQLADYQSELAGVLGGRGPGRLGWVETEGDAGSQARELPGIRTFNAAPTMPYTKVAPPRGQSADELLGVAAAVAMTQGDGMARPAGRAAATALDQTYPDQSASRRTREVTETGDSWSRRFDEWIYATVAVHGDLCVASRLDGIVLGLRASDGEQAWQTKNLGGRIYGSVAIAPSGRGAGGAAFAAVADGSVWAIDLASGEPTQILPRGLPMEGTPVIVDDPVAPRVYFARSDGTLLAVDPRTRDADDLGRLAGGTTGALAATAKMVFAADASGSVHAIDLITCESAGRIVTGGQVVASPVVAGDRLCVAGTDGVLRIAAIPDGTIVKSFDLGAPLHVPPVYDRGLLYAGDSGGTVRAYQLDSGGAEPLSGYVPPVLGQEITGLTASAGVLYAASGYEVTAFDGRTGQPRDQVIRLNCLVAGAPVISGRFCYVAGLGGVVQRTALPSTA